MHPRHLREWTECLFVRYIVATIQAHGYVVALLKLQKKVLLCTPYAHHVQRSNYTVRTNEPDSDAASPGIRML
jgi:putative component of membrane protein insertase Oxa1/YidC/SpoIIIJ protein YidD